MSRKSTANMYGKTALFFTFLLAGSIALPAPELENDLSIFFDHTNGNRIVGGTPAAQGSVPYMVALTNGLIIRGLVCGGSIVNERFILTAAHCIVAVFSGGNLSTSLRGTVGTNTWNLGGEMYSFARNITHEHYNGQTIKNDIGFLITTEDIRFTPGISTVPLSFEYVSGGVAARAAGWGRIRAGGPISAQLLELTVQTITGAQCINDAIQAMIDLNMSAPPIDPSVELCTYHSVGHGMCNGDSGSALVRTDTGHQIALVSWGFPCALGAPDMFARISGFTTWIQNHLN